MSTTTTYETARSELLALLSECPPQTDGEITVGVGPLVDGRRTIAAKSIYVWGESSTADPEPTLRAILRVATQVKHEGDRIRFDLAGVRGCFFVDESTYSRVAAESIAGVIGARPACGLTAHATDAAERARISQIVAGA
jgi:hypothetical protein